jgi:uncharacterized protein YkwD
MMLNRSRTLALAALAILGLASSPRAQDTSPARPKTGGMPPEAADALVRAHNRERAKDGLPPLEANPRLQAAAQAHARDMADRRAMSHEGSDGSTFSQRIERQGYGYRRVGENVAMGQKTAAAVMKDWMNSPLHKANILGDFHEIGVGRAEGKDGAFYWCVDFGEGWPKIDTERAEAGVVEAINRARAEAKPKLTPMTADEALATVARRHARDMATRDTIGKADSDGLTPLERVQKQDLAYLALGECDAVGQTTPGEVVETWMESPPHKSSLLGNFGRIGVGCAVAKNGTPYWTVIFGRPIED